MNFSSLLLPLIIVLFAVPLFLGSRKQKRAQQQQQEMQNSLSYGDRVMTTSGLYATVVRVADDAIELEIAPGVTTSWLRAAVREKVSDPSAGVITDEVDDVDDDEDIDETELHDAEPASTAQVAPSLEESSKKAR